MKQNDSLKMLDLIARPAFCVKDGAVCAMNQGAKQLLLELGTPIDALLRTGKEEYAAFSTGCLHLTLSISGQTAGASVTRMEVGDIFVLEQDAEQGELQAMALAARELRNPLASVMTVTDRLFPMVAGEERLQTQIVQINRGLFQMLRVISNMSDAAHYQEDNMCMEVRDVCALLEEQFTGAKDLAAYTGIQLHYHGVPGPVFTQVDSQKLERAVYNILSNAIKFTPAGGTIQANLARHGEKLYLTVQDSGSGMDGDLRGSAFTRYLRAPGIEDGRFGIGLGMVLVRGTAAIHGGAVLLEQPENGGFRITMTIAIRQGAVLRSPVMMVDYAGERDHRLVELADALPAEVFRKERIN